MTEMKSTHAHKERTMMSDFINHHTSFNLDRWYLRIFNHCIAIKSTTNSPVMYQIVRFKNNVSNLHSVFSTLPNTIDTFLKPEVEKLKKDIDNFTTNSNICKFIIVIHQ